MPVIPRAISRVIPPEQTKICRKCGKRKRLSEFHHDSARKDGHRSACAECENAAAREYRVKHGDEVRRREREGASSEDRRKDTRTRSVVLLFCPRDEEDRAPIFKYPRKFDRLSFQKTLYAGNWPSGCVFEYAKVYRGKRRLWRVEGKHLRKMRKNEPMDNRALQQPRILSSRPVYRTTKE